MKDPPTLNPIFPRLKLYISLVGERVVAKQINVSIQEMEFVDNRRRAQVQDGEQNSRPIIAC